MFKLVKSIQLINNIINPIFKKFSHDISVGKVFGLSVRGSGFYSTKERHIKWFSVNNNIQIRISSSMNPFKYLNKIYKKSFLKYCEF